MGDSIFEIKNLHFSYGEIHAIKGISLKVERNEIVALIGANGAGKTTTLRSVSGLLGNIKSGEIFFDGENITNVSPHKIAAKGLIQVLEGRHVFPKLTVEENLLLGGYCQNAQSNNTTLEYVYQLFSRLRERRKQPGGTLSGGEQQMLAVGRALMAKPKLLMMDEPSLGLAPVIVADIFSTINKINLDGVPLLLVEQNSKASLQIANRGYVLETGEIVISDTAKNLIENDEVRKSYLGE
jgi:branched-chain amino acid transport system ATP-binding protein